MLGAPLKPEITGLFTPPRRLIATRYSESDFDKNRTHTLTLPSVQVTEVVTGNSLQSTPILKPKLRTLPTDMRELSLKDLTREGCKSAEPQVNGGCLNADNMKKVKSASPSAVGQRKHRGHSKSQSLGTKLVHRIHVHVVQLIIIICCLLC